MQRASWTTAIGLALSLGSGAVTVGGWNPHPWIGAVLLVIALLVLFSPILGTPTAVLYQIGFDYLPASPAGSPLDHGWERAYGEGAPEFSVATEGDAHVGMEMRAPDGYAIQYFVSQATATGTDLVRLSIRYTRTSIFQLLVQVAPKGGGAPLSRILKIELEGGQPRSPEQHSTQEHEKIAWVACKHLQNEWVGLNLNVPSLVNAAWRSEGRVFNRLTGVRLRGNVSVSPISFRRWRLRW